MADRTVPGEDRDLGQRDKVLAADCSSPWEAQVGSSLVAAAAAAAADSRIAGRSLAALARDLRTRALVLPAADHHHMAEAHHPCCS